MDLTGDGGIIKETTKAGDGPTPQPGDIVFAHYTGKLSDGQVFDSSIGKPHRKMGFFFELGAGQVIKGWDVGPNPCKKSSLFPPPLHTCG